MSQNPSVVLLAPNSFNRFLGISFENQFQVMTKSGHLASFPNLDILFNNRKKNLDNGFKSYNPMAGYYLESFLKQRNYDCKVVFNWDTDDDLIEAMRSDPLAVCFSTTYVTDSDLLADCVRALRKVAPGVPIIVGGPFIYKMRMEFDRDVTGHGCQTIQLGKSRVEAFHEYDVDLLANCLYGPHTCQDLRDVIYIASEFGEYTLLKVLDAIKQRCCQTDDLLTIPNLVLAVKGGDWHATREEAEPTNLNTDFTRWDLIDVMPPVVPIRSSVGCPFKCKYCDFIELHPRVVMRHPESIVEEIRIAQNCGRHYFNFIDDNIFLNKTRIGNLCKTFVQHDLGVIWGGFFRVDRVDETNIDIIKQSGCSFGLCGIESADPDQLERMNKECKAEEIKRGIELCTAAGMRLLLTFIVGYPGETQESIDNTVDMINSLTTTNRGYASYQVYPFYLLPSSAADSLEFREQYHLKGRYQYWTHYTMNFQEATDTWAPYFFRQVHNLAYDYYAIDSLKGWNYLQRNDAFGLRRELTLAFLDGESDEGIQESFGRLYHFIKTKSNGQTPETPHWSNYLAARCDQPGARRVRERMGG